MSTSLLKLGSPFCKCLAIRAVAMSHTEKFAFPAPWNNLAQMIDVISAISTGPSLLKGNFSNCSEKSHIKLLTSGQIAHHFDLIVTRIRFAAYFEGNPLL